MPLPIAEAAALGERAFDPALGLGGVDRAGPYWQPIALDGTVPFFPGAGLAVGGYYLTCLSDLPALDLHDTGLGLGADGETYDATATAAYRRAGEEALSVYPIFTWGDHGSPNPIREGGCLLARTSCAAPPVVLPAGRGWSPIRLLWVADRGLRPRHWPQRQQSRRGSGYTFVIYGTRRGASQLLRTLRPGAPISDTEALVTRFDFSHDALGVVFHGARAPSFTVATLKRNREQVVARVETETAATTPSVPIVVIAELIRIHRSWLGDRLPTYAKVVPLSADQPSRRG